jgi:hypothetical protein
VINLVRHAQMQLLQGALPATQRQIRLQGTIILFQETLAHVSMVNENKLKKILYRNNNFFYYLKRLL